MRMHCDSWLCPTTLTKTEKLQQVTTFLVMTVSVNLFVAEDDSMEKVKSDPDASANGSGAKGGQESESSASDDSEDSDLDPDERYKGLFSDMLSLQTLTLVLKQRCSCRRKIPAKTVPRAPVVPRLQSETRRHRMLPVTVAAGHLLPVLTNRLQMAPAVFPNGSWKRMDRPEVRRT